MSSIREDMEAAFDQLEGTSSEQEPADTVIEATPEAPIAEAVEPAAEAQPEAQTEGEGAPESAQEGRSRDDKGRFSKTAAEAKADLASKTLAAKPPVAGAQAGGVQPPSSQVAPSAAPAFKPPQSWKPAAREEFAKLPASVQAEVVRVDREVRTTMQEAAKVRESLDAYTKTVSPFEAMIRQRGGEPTQAIGGLLQTAATLWHAPAPQKAQLIAGIVKDYLGTDENALRMLASALDGQPMQPGQGAQPQQAVDPRQIAAQVREQLTRDMAAQRETQATQQAHTDLEQFAQDPEHEFYDDVREDMSALMLAAHQQGKVLSLKDAYKKAVRMNDDISAVMAQREAAKKAQGAQSQAARARRASVSVRPSPTSRQAPQAGENLRGDLDAAFDELASR